MNLPLTRYEQLIAEELAGIITSEDQVILDKAKADHPEVYALWKEQQVLFAQEDVRSWLEQDVAPPALDGPFVVKRSPFRRVLMVTTGIAAITLIIIGSIYFLSPVKEGTLTTSTSKTTIELKLENGKVIDLSQEGKVQAGNISLSNKQKSLTYAAGNNSSGEMATLSVPAGKDYKITLSDGTEIFMNSATSLRFPIAFNGNRREVNITGEAYFKVAKDPSRPFIVNMQKGSVQVLGTEFNVNSYEQQNLQVALVEGKVQFKAGNDSAILKPGIAATYTSQEIQTERFDADDLLSWRKGIFLFNDKALEEVFKVIPRWFGQEVVIDNPAVGKEHFTGVFDRNKTIQKNLDVLKAYNGIDYSIDENNVIHIK